MKRLFVVLTVMTLAAAACGRDSDEPAADTTSTTAPGGGDGTAAAGVDAGAFGDLGVVCSAEGGATDERAGGSGRRGAEVDETGLADGTITIGTFSDTGFSGRPGLNQELFDTGEAFVGWCNEHGGLRGHELVLEKHDAALTEYEARMIEACEGDFFLVGGGAVFDDAGQQTRLGCGLPDLPGFVVTPTAVGADLLVQVLDTGIDTISGGDLTYLVETFPEAAGAVGVFTGNLPTTQTQADRTQEAAEQAGMTVVYDDLYNSAGEANWKPFAQDMQSSGVRGLIWVGEPENLAALVDTFKEIGYAPDWVRTDANHFDPKLIDLAGDSLTAVDVYTRSGFYPFHGEISNPATQDYVDIVTEYSDGKKIAGLGAQSMSAWLLFAVATNACIDAGDLARDCVYTEALAVDGWTGGGLHAPSDPGTPGASPCAALFQATADGFVLVADHEMTDDIFNCDPAGQFALTGDYGTGATCPSGKKDPLPSECG